MAVYAGQELMGNYYAAAYFSVLLTFISIPVATALFPAFSKLNVEKEPELVRTVFASSVKYTSLLLVPATMILITLATPLIGTLFPQAGILHSLFVANAPLKFPYAPLFLVLSSIVNLFVLFGNVSVGTFLTGIGKTKQVMIQSFASLAVGLPAAIFFVAWLSSIGGPSYAVVAGILGTLMATVPTMIWGLYWVWKHYKVKADFGVSAKIFAAAIIASAVTYLFLSFIVLPGNLITLIVGAAIFLIIYLIAAPLLGAINQTDISNFKSMLSGLGPISKILDVPLIFMQKMCKENPANKVLEIGD
jgi:O-antigen/teichoic acid export membrane protein